MAEERKRVAATKGLRQLERLLMDRTQKDFGDEADIPQSALSEILNQWRLPTLEQAVKLAKYGIAEPTWTQPDAEQVA
jgi:hypothetical protein